MWYPCNIWPEPVLCIGLGNDQSPGQLLKFWSAAHVQFCAGWLTVNRGNVDKVNCGHQAVTYHVDEFIHNSKRAKNES